MRLLTPKRLRENEEFMWRLADRVDRRVHRSGGVRVHARVRQPFAMLVIADLLGVPEDDHDAFRGSCGRKDAGGRQHRRRGDGAQPAGVPLRPVHRLHRGPPALAPGGRPHRAGDRHVPRRLRPRGHGRRPGRRQSVRGRPGDHRPAPRRVDAAARRATPNCSSVAGRSGAASPTSSRSASGSRARSRATSACRGCRRPSEASTSPPAPR